MVPLNNPQSLRSVWQALSSSNAESHGWRTLKLEVEGVPLRAGRRLPENQEALMVGFTSVPVPPDKNLPQGQGFAVNRIRDDSVDRYHTWVTLSRLPAGNLDMFTLMVEDIISFLGSRPSGSQDMLFHAFLGRIRAWQNFMDQNTAGILSTEGETGLFGELVVLEALSALGLPPRDLIRMWQGPAGGIHDFSLGTGGIEVKTTLAKSIFPAKISSLDQLDDHVVKPLWLTGVRLALIETGQRLPELARGLREVFSSDPNALQYYENRLIQAGLLEAHDEEYTRRFIRTDVLVWQVDENFPKLTPANVPVEIRKAVYEIDLALIKTPAVTLDAAVTALRNT
jgi:hypothetical protein